MKKLGAGLWQEGESGHPGKGWADHQNFDWAETLEAENLKSEAKLREKDKQIIQREAEWNINLKAREGQSSCELAAKKGRNVEEERRNKVRQM